MLIYSKLHSKSCDYLYLSSLIFSLSIWVLTDAPLVTYNRSQVSYSLEHFKFHDWSSSVFDERNVWWPPSKIPTIWKLWTIIGIFWSEPDIGLPLGVMWFIPFVRETHDRNKLHNPERKAYIWLIFFFGEDSSTEPGKHWWKNVFTVPSVPLVFPWEVEVHT